MTTKSKPEETESRVKLDPLAVADIECGISLLNVIVEYVEGELHQTGIDDSGHFLMLTALQAMLQKAGATIERGYGIAIGDRVGIGAGLIGNADEWMTDPADRKRRHELSRRVSA